MNNTLIDTTKYNSQQENNNSGFNIYGVIVLVLLCSLISIFGGYILGKNNIIENWKYARNSWMYGSNNPSNEASTYSAEQLSNMIDSSKFDFNLYYQIIGNLKDKYVDINKIKDEELFDGTVKGMVESIGDPATVYMNQDDYREYKESFSGQFDGIGVRLEYLNNRVVISSVIPNSPAESSNLQAGFIFIEVDGKNVESYSMDDVVNAVRGVSGTSVNLKFFDPVKNETIEKTVKRAPIVVEPMRLIEKNSETVVFEISRFTDSTPEEWKSKWDKYVKNIVDKGYKNVIIDLRGNTGGYLLAAQWAASDLLPNNSHILTEKTRNNGDIKLYTNKAKPALLDKNLVILVNGGTASASEILAGAVKFHKKDIQILGTKTYGKGTVQNTYELENGGALKITTEYWLLPDGKKLDQDNPIYPDKEINLDQEKYREGKDNVMDEALNILN